MTADEMTKTKFEVQVRYPQGRTYSSRDWHLAEYAKRGEVSRKLVFKTVTDALKERRAMTARSKKYGWGAEYRIVKVVTTYEVIA